MLVHLTIVDRQKPIKYDLTDMIRSWAIPFLSSEKSLDILANVTGMLFVRMWTSTYFLPLL